MIMSGLEASYGTSGLFVVMCRETAEYDKILKFNNQKQP